MGLLSVGLLCSLIYYEKCIFSNVTVFSEMCLTFWAFSLCKIMFSVLLFLLDKMLLPIFDLFIFSQAKNEGCGTKLQKREKNANFLFK